MTSIFSVDPFTQTYQRILAALRSRNVMAKSRPGNIITFKMLATRLSVDPAPADLVGELTVIPTPGGTANFAATSSSTLIEKSFGIRIRTRDLNADKHLFPLEWELLQAYAAFGVDMGLPEFVTGWTVTGLFNEDEPTDPNDAWQDFQVINVKYRFRTASLVAGKDA